jgi:hypothetical protein
MKKEQLLKRWFTVYGSILGGWSLISSIGILLRGKTLFVKVSLYSQLIMYILVSIQFVRSFYGVFSILKKNDEKKFAEIKNSLVS